LHIWNCIKLSCTRKANEKDWIGKQMRLVDLDSYHIAAPLLQHFTFEPLMQCMVEGIIKGYIYLDDMDQPKVAYAQFRHRGFITGDISAMDPDAFHKFIRGEALPNCRKADVPLLRLTPGGPEWLSWLEKAIAPLSPETVDYQTYSINLGSEPGIEVSLPKGFTLYSTSKALVEGEFDSRQDLLDEMRAERNTVAGFLKHSFGIVAFHDNRLAGWCLSEYNHDTRCAVGITTMPSFRRMGIARVMTVAFLDLARSNGVETVLWHCYKSNVGSAKTAKSAGFRLADEHKVLNIYL
jgi:predicted acetyltransferase